MEHSGERGEPRDDGTIWLDDVPEDLDDGQPRGPRRRRPRVTLVGVLAAALIGTAGVAAARHEASLRWEQEAVSAQRESDQLADQLARTEVRLAQLQDTVDRSERAQRFRSARLADLQLLSYPRGETQ